MRQSELHLLELVIIFYTAYQALHLEADASEQFICCLTSLTGYPKLLLDALSQLLLCNEQLFFDTLLDNILVEELVEAF